MKFEDSLVGNKAYEFALRIIKVKKEIEDKHREYDIARQLLRSGTSIGANISEACGGLTKADFSAKMSIAYKESLEVKFWLRLIKDSYLLDSGLSDELISKCDEISKMLFAILKKSGRIN